MKRNTIVDINISIHVFTSKTVDKTYITRFENIIADGEYSFKGCYRLSTYKFYLTDCITDTDSFTISDHKVTIYAADKNFSTYVNQAFQKILKRSMKNHKKIQTTCMSIYIDETVDEECASDFVDLVMHRKNSHEEIEILKPYKFHLTDLITNAEGFTIQGHEVTINAADDYFSSYANLALNHIIKEEQIKKSNDDQLCSTASKQLRLCIITRSTSTEQQ